MMAPMTIQVDGSWEKTTLLVAAGWFVNNAVDNQNCSGGYHFIAKSALQ